MPAQFGAQTHWSPLQVVPAPQVPQSPPHPLEPQFLPAQFGAQTHWSPLQTCPAPQVPQAPPQPSGPQLLPAQLGWHTASEALHEVLPPGPLAKRVQIESAVGAVTAEPLQSTGPVAPSQS